jgi:hypothetical protein
MEREERVEAASEHEGSKGRGGCTNKSECYGRERKREKGWGRKEMGKLTEKTTKSIGRLMRK